MIVDERFDAGPDGYILTQIRHTGGHTLRVRIRRDTRPSRSWAVVEVLTPHLTWTRLAAEPASAWHPLIPHQAGAAVATGHLHVLANRLTQRATTILATPAAGGPPPDTPAS